MKSWKVEKICKSTKIENCDAETIPAFDIQQSSDNVHKYVDFCSESLPWDIVQWTMHLSDFKELLVSRQNIWKNVQK